MEDVVNLDELNSDHNPVLLMVISSSPAQMRRSMCHIIRWGVFRQHLKKIEYTLDSFRSTDEYEPGIEAFTNTLRSAMIAGQVHKSRAAIKYFPVNSDIVAEKLLIRNRWHCYRQKVDKIEFNRLFNLIQHGA